MGAVLACAAAALARLAAQPRRASAAAAAAAAAGRRAVRPWPGRASTAAPAGELSVALLQTQRAAGREVRRRAHAADAGLGRPRAARRARRPGAWRRRPRCRCCRSSWTSWRPATGRRCARTSPTRAPAAPRWSACRWATTSAATPTRWPGCRRRRATYRYDKYHLVPFGEFIPTRLPLVHRADEHPAGRLRPRRRRPAVVRRAAASAWRPTSATRTCSARNWRAASPTPPRRPTVLANVSNIGWFGDTIATVQHLNISRLRALEFQRPMIRATNTGATAIIDHRGVGDGRCCRRTPAACSRAACRAATASRPIAWWTARAGLWPLRAGGAGSRCWRPLRAALRRAGLERRRGAPVNSQAFAQPPPCSPSSRSSSSCRATGTPRAAPCCSPTTWRSAPAPATPPPSCARSAPSPGRPPTCSPAAAPRTAATARTRTGCSTTTSTRWCSSRRRPTSWSCTSAASRRWAST